MVFNDYIVRVISTIFIFMILAVSYNLINGVTGQLSLEPNGFVAVGAYVTALLILSSDSKVDMFEMAAPARGSSACTQASSPPADKRPVRGGAGGVPRRAGLPGTWRLRPLSPSALGLSSRSSLLTTRKSPTAPSG